MILESPGEIAFHLFNLPVYFYGIIMAVAILVGVFTAFFLYRRYYGIRNSEYIFDMSPFIIIAGIVGARLYYCLLNFNYYYAHPGEIFDIRQGGLSIHGMIIFGLIGLWGFAKLFKMSFPKLLDVMACGTIIAQAIGRWGNFFNSEAFGSPVNFGIKLFIPVEKRPYMYLNHEYFHPTFLYESVLNILIFIALLAGFKKLSKRPGLIACTYFILYSTARIFVEQLRVDSVLNIGGIPVAQLVSLLIIIITMCVIPFIIKSAKE